MRLPTFPVFLLATSIALTAQMKRSDEQMPVDKSELEKAERVIVVTTPDWDSVDGTMKRFERRDGKWVAVGTPVPVVVGKNGMRMGLTEGTAVEGTKREGDGRSPAGGFWIGEVFGFDERGPTRRDYVPLLASTECVDDVKSVHYAQIVDRNKVPKVDWNSSEKMREIDVYKLGMVVRYNTPKTVPGNGSCIFLHIWKGPGRGTAGCTAMAEEHLQELVQWVGDAKALLVQLPADVYMQANKTWGLP